jgi:hypothetical protein
VNNDSGAFKKTRSIIRVLIFIVCIWGAFWCGVLFSYNQSFRCETTSIKSDLRLLEAFTSKFGMSGLESYLTIKKNALEVREDLEKEISFLQYLIAPIAVPMGLYDLNKVCSYRPDQRLDVEQ